MQSPLGNFLLSAVLIAVPAGGFAAAEHYVMPAAPSAAAAHPGLGDLSAYETIVADTARIAGTGDLAAAERRITDLETLWDDSEPALRPLDPGTWRTVDLAADKAFSALRASRPDPAKVDAALRNLSDTLADPVPATADQPVRTVAGIAVTDETGHALPCEDLVGRLRAATRDTTPSADVADLKSKAIERCNADDDARADAFAAQALAKIKG